MSKFAVGDQVAMPGVPLTVEVLELGQCRDDNCGQETFRFTDPVLKEDDWVHTEEFELA